MKRDSICFLVVLAFSVCVAAQDETPLRVTNQNRTGDLPFSTSIGTSIEHVDLSSGTLNVQIPIFTIKGRGMDSHSYVHFNSNYFTRGNRLDAYGNPYYQWNFEQNSDWYNSSPWTSRGLVKMQYQLSTATALWYESQMYTDEAGTKHPLAIQGASGTCAGPGDAQGPDLQGAGTWGVYLSGNVLFADGTTQSNGNWTDSNGNQRGPGMDTLGRTLPTAQAVYDANG